MKVEASTTVGGYTPNGKARIYNTSKEGVDPDLESPNEKCGGNGKGSGGEPGRPGANCNPKGEGNVLIIQESEKALPNDNALGGMIMFAFDCPLSKLLSIGLIDIETWEQAFFEVFEYGAPKIQMIEGLGDNSVQTEAFDDAANVTGVNVMASNSFGVCSICFCNGDCEKPKSPPPSYPSLPSNTSVQVPAPPPTGQVEEVSTVEELEEAIEASASNFILILAANNRYVLSSPIDVTDKKFTLWCDDRCIIDGKAAKGGLFTTIKPSDFQISFYKATFQNGKVSKTPCQAPLLLS